MNRKILFRKCFLAGLYCLLRLSLWSQDCTGSLSISLIGSDSADSLEVTVSSEDITCASDVNGNLILTVEGGSPNYQYTWADDVNLVDSIRYNLEQGIYMVTITDHKGCSKELSWEIQELGPDNSDLTMTDACGVCWIDNGESAYFFGPNTKYIAAVSDQAPDMADLESTEVCVFMDDIVQTCQNHPYLQRQWSVDPNQSEDACIKLFFTQEELDNLAAAVPNETVTAQDLINNERICLTAWSGGNETCGDFETEIIYSTAAAPPLVVQLEDPIKEIWSVEVCTDQFATFYVHVCEYLLPVELVHFSGIKVGDNNRLNWETASEINTSHFELEKSIDGSFFNFLSKIEAKGTSSQTASYTYLDQYPSDNKDYYRLKIVDQNGSFAYSNTVVIDRSPQNTSQVYPTIFSKYVFYETQLNRADRLEVLIFDAIGQIAHTQNFQLDAGAHRLVLKLDRLPAGNYYLQINIKGRDVMESFKLQRY